MNAVGYSTLDQDVHSSRQQKYEKSQLEAAQWVLETLAKSDPSLANQDPNQDLSTLLKDGLLLCKLGSLVGVENSPTRKARNSKMPFVQMENIMFFLQLCDQMGVAHDEIFQTDDLFYDKDPYQVVVTLMAFSRKANERKPDVFTVLGPKVGPKSNQ